MSEKDIQDHLDLMRQTGKFKLSEKKEDIIHLLMDGADIELEEDSEPTMDLPILGKR